MKNINLFRIKDLLKNTTWSFLLRLGINSNPFLFSLLDAINNFSNSNLYNWRYYFKSKNRDPSLVNGEVTCIMCTWMEEIMVPLAIESSKDFVSRYIVVDKDGKTVPAIKECRDKWDLEMEIYVKPKMSLRESREFALMHVDSPWVLIQDGDEIFHTDGPNAISGLRRFMDRPNTVFMCYMNRLCGDIWHIDPNQPQNSYHPFLYHNNGTLRAPNPKWDIPIMDGWKVYLSKPYKFNCIIKSPKRMFLRQFWREWCQHTEKYLKYPNIEGYVTKELGIDVATETEKWYKMYLRTLIPYDEERWGYYPNVIRKYQHAQEPINCQEIGN